MPLQTIKAKMNLFLLAVTLALGCIHVQAQNILLVHSISELQAAINGSAPGDTLVVSNGTYINSNLVINKNGITIKAETPGGVYLNGAQYIDIVGDNNTFSGFQFTSGDIGEAFVIEVSGDHNLLTQLNFNGYSAKKYIQFEAGSQYNELSYSNIENKPANAVIGCTIQISTSFNTPGYHSIHHCSFKNFPGDGGDFGNEPIRIGLGAERDNISRTVVEYCYFENVGKGDGESISIKCCENVCRYNTFTNNPDGMLVFRNGDRNVAYGNFFINNSGGIRVKEARDTYCYNNYFETGAVEPIVLQYVAEMPLVNANFIYNTFVNCDRIDLGRKGPASVTFANNIFSNSSGSIFKNATGAENYINNLVKGSLGIPANVGLINSDAALQINDEGYYELSANSIAINAATNDYPSMIDITELNDDPDILFDLKGLLRVENDSLKDIGCTEYFSTGISINRPLKDNEVGPTYNCYSYQNLLSQTITFNELPELTLGNPDFDPGAEASSGLPVRYESSNKSVATIVEGKIHLIGEGTCTITASQKGDSIYTAAPGVSQKLIVNPSTSAILLAHENNRFTAYPNPAHSFLIIKSNSEQFGQAFSIVGIDGRIKYKGKINLKNQIIDVRALPQGAYVLVLDQSNAHFRFIKK